MSRFLLLDGIRGLAAVFILLRHTLPYWTFGFSRSYLAVDLFFVLSGFVIAQAYDQRLKTKSMSFVQFVKVRLIRMYPMYLLSLVLCVLVWSGHWQQAAVPLLLALFFLPSSMPGGPTDFLFPTNGPYWSLMFELVVNFVYAAIRRWLSTPVLVGIVAVAAGGLAVSAWLGGNLDMGWTWGVRTLAGGAARAFFGIFLGLLLHRFHDRWAPAVGRWLSPWVAFVLVGVALASPDAGAFNGLVDFLLVAGVFPFLILAASRYTGGRAQGIAVVLGAASYPVYVLHQQVGLIFQYGTGSLVRDTAPWSGFLFVTALIVLSLVLEQVFDLPIRRWLKKKLLPEKAG
jgi:peptidoglycan/LPS O-acetylase OafA/YrhL